MSDYRKCPICKQWGWMPHTCPPAYGVRPDDYDREDEVAVYANSPEEAATTWLDDHFYDFECPTHMTVIVNDWRANNNAGHEYTYEITVEQVPSFSAELIKEGEPESEEQA